MFRQAVILGDVDANPVTAVRKPAARRRRRVIALTVEQVEALLGHLRDDAGADAAMLAELIAYSGARPQDALAVPHRHVGRSTIVYADKNVDGDVVPGSKTGLEKIRSVRLLRNLRADLLAHRMAAGNPAGAALIVARADGGPWREHDYRNWYRRHFRPAAVAAGVPHAVPYDLRHTCASLRLAEQRLSLQELAEEMGHGVQVLAETYAHVIADLRGVGPIDPDALIDAVRRRPKNAPTTDVAADHAAPSDPEDAESSRRAVQRAPQKRSKNASDPTKPPKPTGGLEPPTPSLRVMCSTS
jgi:integrase